VLWDVRDLKPGLSRNYLSSSSELVGFVSE